jgi:callose synthase
LSGIVQVKAAIASLKVIDDLPMPPDVTWTPEMDMLDWLGGFFGFQVFTLTLI